MEEIEFFTYYCESFEKYTLMTKKELQYMADSTSEDSNELLASWGQRFKTIKLFRMKGIPYDNK